VIPAHVESGIKILGPFPSIDDPDTFFFMRGFPDRTSHEPMKARLHEAQLWTSELKPILFAMLDHYDVVVVEAADGVVH
jgi:hypothetical protein